MVSEWQSWDLNWEGWHWTFNQYTMLPSSLDMGAVFNGINYMMNCTNGRKQHLKPSSQSMKISLHSPTSDRLCSCAVSENSLIFFWGRGSDSENYKECISGVQVLVLWPLEKGLIPLIWSHLDYVDLFDFSFKGQFFKYLRVVLTHVLPGSFSHYISHFSCFHTAFPILLHDFQTFHPPAPIISSSF